MRSNQSDLPRVAAVVLSPFADAAGEALARERVSIEIPGEILAVDRLGQR